MQVTDCEITYIGFIDIESKESLDKEISGLSQPDEATEITRYSQAGGTFSFEQETRTLQVPESLNYFQSIKVSVGRYYIFPFVYTVEVEGTIFKHLLDGLLNLSEKESFDLLKKYRKDLWDYCKDLLPMKNTEQQYRDGCSITYYHIDSKETDDILGKEWDKDLLLTADNLREKSILNNLDSNTAGLISLHEVYTNKITIITQTNAVTIGGGEIDFSGIGVFVFGQTNKDLGSLEKYIEGYGKVHDLLLTHLLLNKRARELPDWREKVGELRNEIEKLELFRQQIDIERADLSFASQGRFLAEYSKFLEEHDHVLNFVQREKTSLRSPFEEVGLPNRIMLSLQMGLLTALVSDIANTVEIIKEEFNSLKKQYDILASFRTDMMNLASAQSNLKLTQSNTRMQFIMVGLTVAVVVLAGISTWKILFG